MYAIGFNPKYIGDVYDAIGHNAGVKLQIGDEDSVIKVDFGRNDGVEYYVMPMLL